MLKACLFVSAANAAKLNFEGTTATNGMKLVNTAGVAELTVEGCAAGDVGLCDMKQKYTDLSTRFATMETYLGFVGGVPPIVPAWKTKQTCQDWADLGNTADGVKKICPTAATCFDVYCRHKNGKAWALVMTRGPQGSVTAANPLFTDSGANMLPMSGNGAGLNSVQFAALKSVSTLFAFEVDAASCNGHSPGATDGYDNWGTGMLSNIDGGNNCNDLGDDLTKCDLVHNENSGCTYTGGDYSSIFGVASSNGPGINDRCSYFNNGGGTKSLWSNGAACANNLYPLKSDLYLGSVPVSGNHRTCQSWYDAGSIEDGIKSICPTDTACFDAYCRTQSGKSWTLVLTRGVGLGAVQSAPLTPMSGNGGVLSSENWIALKSVSTEFAFQIDEVTCGAGNNNWGFGSLSKLESGNNCQNIGDDLTKCNLVHNEASGPTSCAYSGGDYNSMFGVSSDNQEVHAYPDSCNYFSNRGTGAIPLWTEVPSLGPVCGGKVAFYAAKSDLYVN
jgi:hypothetical protein